MRACLPLWIVTAGMAVAPVSPAQTTSPSPDPLAALAELVAADTPPERRGELFAELRRVEFQKIGKELARELGKPRGVQSGIGWQTMEPWLETGLAPSTRALGTLFRLWECHMQHPLDLAKVQMLWGMLEDPSFGTTRHLAADVLLPAGEPEPAEVTDRTLARLDRLARIDAEPAFRATCLLQLGKHIAMDGYVDLAIEIARTSADPVRSHGLLWWWVWKHVPGMTAEPRARLLRFAFDLLRRREHQPGDQQDWLVGPLANELGLVAATSATRGEGPTLGAAELLATVARAAPFVQVSRELVQRTHGTAKVVCRSQWRSLDGHALEAIGVLRLGLGELLPLLPKEWPVPSGASWNVRGEDLVALARGLAGLHWDDGACGDVWGWELFEHVIQPTGSLAVTVERRNDKLGFAVAGSLCVHETGRCGARFGPNDFCSDATHQLAFWLPLDANNRIAAFDLHDEVAITGSYGKETFTRQESFTSEPGPLLSPAERGQAEELLAAVVKGDEAATKKLVARGTVVAPELILAIGRANDFGVKRRLTAVLRQITKPH